MKLKVKSPGTKRLKLKCDILLSTSALKANLRRYTAAVAREEREEAAKVAAAKVGRCRLTPG
jgi:hypothetical protein